MVAVIGLALVAGFLIGTWWAGPEIRIGRADSTADGGGSIEAGDWTYGFGTDTTWVASGDVWHDSGVPDCLPVGSSVEGVRFAAIDVSIEGVGWRPVVWIDCRSVPAP
jgi:hypothetical protein